MMKVLFLQKRSNNTYILSLVCLVAVISANWTSTISHHRLPTSDQLKVGSNIPSCDWSWTSASSLVFQPWTLVGRFCWKRLHARRIKCSSISLQRSISHFHPKALRSLFRNFHTMRPDHVLWTKKPSTALNSWVNRKIRELYRHRSCL